MHRSAAACCNSCWIYATIDEDLPMMLRVAENTKCPISFSITQADKRAAALAPDAGHHQ